MPNLQTLILSKSSLLALALISSAVYADVRSDMMELWDGRSATYERQEASDLESRKIALAALAEAKSEADTRAVLLKAYDTTFVYGQAHGRTIALSQAREFFRKKRSAGAAEIWMQGQVSQMQQSTKVARTRLESIKNLPESMSLTDKLNATLSAISESGIAQGVIDELTLLDANLSSYYRAKSAEDQARREARARMLGALAAAFAPPDDRSIHVNCRQSMLGNTVQCTGTEF